MQKSKQPFARACVFVKTEQKIPAVVFSLYRELMYFSQRGEQHTPQAEFPKLGNHVDKAVIKPPVSLKIGSPEKERQYGDGLPVREVGARFSYPVPICKKFIKIRPATGESFPDVAKRTFANIGARQQKKAGQRGRSTGIHSNLFSEINDL